MDSKRLLRSLMKEEHLLDAKVKKMMTVMRVTQVLLYFLRMAPTKNLHSPQVLLERKKRD
jgi:hypothetical protein